MTRFFLLLLATIVGAGYVANAIKDKGPGYVYIYFDQYSIETSVWFALALLIVFIVAIVVLLKFIPWLVNFLRKLGYFPKSFLVSRAKKLRYEGRLAFLNQQWRTASKKLSKAGKNSNTSFIDYVMASRSALAINDIEKAQYCANLASSSSDFDAVTFALLQIDLAMTDCLSIEEEHTLQALLDTYPTEPVFLERAVRLYSQLGKWQLLHQLLPKLKKYKVYDEAAYEKVLVNIATGLMPVLAGRGDIAELKALWKSVAKVHDNELVLLAYCQALLTLHEHEQAQKILELHLRKHWSDKLAQQYIQTVVQDKQKQLQFAEALLAQHGQKVTLLTILGSLAKENAYYAKSKEYFDKSLQLQVTPEALRGLAELAVTQHDYGRAVQLLQQALALKTQ